MKRQSVSPSGTLVGLRGRLNLLLTSCTRAEGWYLLGCEWIRECALLRGRSSELCPLGLIEPGLSTSRDRSTSPRLDRGLGARLQKQTDMGEKQKCCSHGGGANKNGAPHRQDDGEAHSPESGCLRISGHWRIRCWRQPHFLERCSAFGFYEARSRLTATHGHWKVFEIIDRAPEESSHNSQRQNMRNINLLSKPGKDVLYTYVY